MQIELPDSVFLDPVRMGTALAVLVLAGAVGHFLGHGLARLLDRAGRAGRWARLTRRLVRWAGVALGTVLALQVLGLTAVASSLLATGGVAAIILGFAFRDIGENLLAGIFLAFSRSFDVGDLIESGGYRGVVKSIEVRETHIRTADGQDVFIPSAEIYRNALSNFTRDGLRRGTFTLGVDYGDDPEVVLDTLRAAVESVEGVRRTPPVTVELSEFLGAWMEFRVHLWVNVADGASLSTARTAAMIAARKALLDGGFTLSADTTTALSLPRMDVRLSSATEPDTP